MFDVSFQLLCATRSGTLSRVVREISLFGLQYQNHKIETEGKHSRLSVNANGELSCDSKTLEELFYKFPEVLKVQQLNVTRDGKPVVQFKSEVLEQRISAREAITPSVLLAAEKRLSEILGPVASILIDSIVDDCSNAGELYAGLAEELYDQEERDLFLAVIEDD